MNNIPMHYNQTRNQLLIIYLRKKVLIKGLENNGCNNTYTTDTIEWGKTGTKEKKKKKINLKKIKYTIKNILGYP